MADDVGLTPEAQLAVRQYVSRYLLGIAAIIGLANVAALFGALYFLVGESARQAVDRELSALRVREELSSTLIELGAAQQQISAAQQQISALTRAAEPLIEQADILRANLDTVMGAESEVIGDAALIIQVAQNNPEFADLASRADVRIEASEGVGLRAFVGKTCSVETSWQPCPSTACGSLTNRSGILQISMAEAQFTETPAVFVSQSGTGSWTTSGLHAIYDINPNSFSLFAYNEFIGDKTYAEYANSSGHCVNWLAVGR